MKLLERTLKQRLEEKLFMGKAIIVTGARQVGKSTLMRQITEDHADRPALMLNCDLSEVRDMLSAANLQQLRMLVGNHRLVVIDEAQRVANIGMTLKIITDYLPDVQLLVTGSSSLSLQNQLSEPLTGRKFEYHLYPISTSELLSGEGLLSVREKLGARLIYGSYPDILMHADQAVERLKNLSGSYLYQDILALDGVRKPVLLEKLLVALALQMGSEVSYNELAQTVGSDAKTVEKYVDLLEKCFVVFRLHAFSRNLRTELKKSRKIYFYDNGVRNAIINNFNALSLRNDVGALWENFFISERIKANHYAGRYVNSFFWRTTKQQEIDYIEESNGSFAAFEMKWNPKKQGASLPQLFQKTYPISTAAVVTPDNYMEWLV